MRFCLILIVCLCAKLHANHPANVLEKLGDYTPTLTFTESVAQRVVGSGENRETVDDYSASFRVVVGAENFASLTSASEVRLRIGNFLLDTTLGAARDYVAGGKKATFPLLEGEDTVGSVKAKWGGETLTITGKIKSRFIPPVATFHIAQLEEDGDYFINQATSASLIFGDISGSRSVELKGRSSFKHVLIGPADEPAFEDDLWKVSIAGGLDFSPPKMKLLPPGKFGGATPRRYVLSTSPDVDRVTVADTVDPLLEPLLREANSKVKPDARLWDGLLYLEPGETTVEFTAVDRSGNSATNMFVFTHDWRIGVYSGLVSGGDDPFSTLVITVAPGGAFTGTMFLGLEKFRFKGLFDADGLTTFQVPRPKGGTALEFQLNLNIDESNFAGEPDPKPTVFAGFFTDGPATYVIDASRAVFETEGVLPEQIEGYYTAQLSNESDEGPEGSGILSLKVNATASASAVGKLADGTPFSLSGPIGGDGRLLIAKKLYAAPAGFLLGFVTFSTENGPRCEGTLRWNQPVGAKKANHLFADGFNAEVRVDGNIYVPGHRDPDDGDKTPLGFVSEARIVFQLGDFETVDLEREFDIDTEGRVRILSAAPEEKLKLSVTNKTGIFTGSIRAATHASPNKKFFGIINSEVGFGEGAFLSKTDSGYVRIGER